VKPKVILGPPGCGKTTFLLERVNQEMQDGIHPSRIAYVSFTRKAAAEAATRAIEKFNAQKKDFPYFRTLHSLAYQELGLTRERVMGAGQYKQIGNALGLIFSDYMDFEEGLPVSAKTGDQVIYIVAMARATLRTTEEQYRAYQAGEVTLWQVKQFEDTLKEYKRQTGMLDFSDMLDTFVDQCAPLDIDVAVIDEAQDLSKQQWRMVMHAIKRAKRVYIAGDDDQAIYRWSGADVDSFLTLDGDRTVLEQSYRLPEAVHTLCSRIAHRIGRRYPKVWKPRAEKGSVSYLTVPQNIEWQDGTYLLLARNRYLLERFREVVHSAGIPYAVNGKSIIDHDAVRAIITWERLRRGEPQDAEDVRNLYAFLRTGTGVKRGFKKLPGVSGLLTLAELREHHGLMREDIWHEALEGIAAEEREFYLAARRRGEKISTMPRVNISTIHGVKGGEADHVVLLSDMAARTYNEFRNDPDDEHRVAYVGASRARKTLSIVMPQSGRAYDYR
jgi:DNA helicase II / ATP-dependent DNA helicase PcrA